jgi:hypothetical protein
VAIQVSPIEARSRSDLHHRAGSAVHDQVGSRDPFRLFGGEVEAAYATASGSPGLPSIVRSTIGAAGAFSPNSSNIASIGGPVSVHL